MKIRKVTNNDLEALVKIGKETFSETYTSQNKKENMTHYLTSVFSTEQLTTELRDPNSQFYFVELNNVPIGYLKLNTGPAQTEIKDSPALEIERIYVLKEYHGKQVGQKLYDKALEIAHMLQVEYVWLGVWEQNPRAIRFYEKNGFVAFDRRVFQLGDEQQTDSMMKLVLK